MSGWYETTLGEIAEIKIGRTPPRKEARYWTNRLDRPFCTIADMEGRAVNPRREGVTEAAEAEGKAKRFPAGALLMSFKLSIGRIGFAARDVFPNEAIAWLRPTIADLDARYLALWLEGQDLTPGAGRAVKGNTLNRESLRAIAVCHPAPPEQRRIIDAMDALDGQVEALEHEADVHLLVYENSVSLLWQGGGGGEAALQSLSWIMTLDLDRVALEPAEEYRLAGVLNAGRGLVDKGSFIGKSTTYAAMNRLRANQVVMRKLTAWEGPITVVPGEFDGFLASNEFPTFTLSHAVSPEWMRHVCRTNRLWAEMRNRVTGSVQRRKRLSPEQLLAVELPVPDLTTQRRVAAGLDALLEQQAHVATEAATLRLFRSALLTALLNRSITIPESYDDLLEGVL